MCDIQVDDHFLKRIGGRNGESAADADCRPIGDRRADIDRACVDYLQRCHALIILRHGHHRGGINQAESVILVELEPCVVGFPATIAALRIVGWINHNSCASDQVLCKPRVQVGLHTLYEGQDTREIWRSCRGSAEHRSVVLVRKSVACPVISGCRCAVRRQDRLATRVVRTARRASDDAGAKVAVAGKDAITAQRRHGERAWRIALGGLV